MHSVTLCTFAQTVIQFLLPFATLVSSSVSGLCASVSITLTSCRSLTACCDLHISTVTCCSLQCLLASVSIYFQRTEGSFPSCLQHNRKMRAFSFHSIQRMFFQLCFKSHLKTLLTTCTRCDCSASLHLYLVCCLHTTRKT